MLHAYQTRIKKEYKIAFYSTLLFSLLIHIYKFTNTLPNHDSLFNYYSDQNVLGSGRWALSLACGMSSYYDLPWVNGLVSCIFIALTVVVIVAVLKIKNPIFIGLTGALLAASPATTQTFFFLFTADGYMIAMFLAALAVYFSKIEEKRWSRWILSGVCICFSCGIYQAYVSFALLLALCYFIDALLNNDYSKQECFKWMLRQIILYMVSLAIYYAIWKLCMYITGTAVNNYQGISEVGKNSTGLLLSGIKVTIKTTILYFLQWDVFKHGLTLYGLLNIILILVLMIGLFVACKKSGIFHRKWAMLLLLLCIFAAFPFACIWCFTSETVAYRAMMLQSLTLFFVLTALLYEKWAKSVGKNVICVFLTLIIINNALMANISYFYMNLCYERTYADGLEMMMEIHDLQDEYEFNKIAVIGSKLSEVQYDNVELETGGKNNFGSIHILSSLLEQTLLFDAVHTTRFLKATFGLDLQPVTYEELEELLLLDETQEMGCWPTGDSITVINDTLVIKLADERE